MTQPNLSLCTIPMMTHRKSINIIDYLSCAQVMLKFKKVNIRPFFDGFIKGKSNDSIYLYILFFLKKYICICYLSKFTFFHAREIFFFTFNKKKFFFPIGAIFSLAGRQLKAIIHNTSKTLRLYYALYEHIEISGPSNFLGLLK